MGAENEPYFQCDVFKDSEQLVPSVEWSRVAAVHLGVEANHPGRGVAASRSAFPLGGAEAGMCGVRFARGRGPSSPLPHKTGQGT